MKDILTLMVCMLVVPLWTHAHSGGTNADGCHTNHETGEYHCHSAKTAAKENSKTAARTLVRTEARTDRNCADFTTHHQAQTFYERTGGPLIDPHDLDRDRDGIACEALQ